MKKYLFASAIVVALALLLYRLAGLATVSDVQNTGAIAISEQPPAAYPQDFEQRLGKVHSTRIQLHADDEVPADLTWSTCDHVPTIGSEQATKGGTMRMSNVGPFPSNFLAFGSPAPQFFHYNLFDRLEVPLVREHPTTGEMIPGLAEAWAEHNGALWFRLNPAARYNNGRPVRAADFALRLLLENDCGQTQAATVIKELHIYGDNLLAVIPQQAGLWGHYKVAAVLKPAEPGFYRNFGADYATRYAQLPPPGTGAYVVSKVQKGRLIVLSRNKNWWAKDLPGFRYTCNADHIEHHFLTDEAQAWEMFMRGRLDMMQTRNIVAWQEYGNQLDNRIVRHRFELSYPMPPYGIALNSKKLSDLSLRKGIMHALNMEQAIHVIFRGDAERLPQFSTGFKTVSLINKHYDFDAQKARNFFAAAGYTETGGDGILRNREGHKLSLRFTYTPNDKVSTMVSILAQYAAECGLEIVPEAVAWQQCSQMVDDGSYDMTFWATVADPILPKYSRFFHSSASGSDAPFHLNSEEIDRAIGKVEQASTIEEAKAACAAMENLIQEYAIWLPGWMENRVNVAAWDYVHLPQSGYSCYDVAESHTYWLSK